MRNFIVIAAVLGLSIAAAEDAAAWHRDGHFTIARIAWKQLTDAQRIQITKILKAHPHYAIYLAADAPKDISEAEWAFLRASTWSDWVRDPFAAGLSGEERASIKKNYNKPVWHYIDLPFIHPDDTAKFDEAAIRKEILLPELDENGEPRHVLAALKRCMRLLTSADSSDENKAVQLCWLLHLVGDLHQPLHATGFMASKETFPPGFDPPGGDQGGNLLLIKVKVSDSRAVNLHAYWDALLFSKEQQFAQVEALAAKLMNDPRLQRDQLPELKSAEFLAWAEESLDLAKTVVYKGDGGFLKAQGLAPKKSGGSQAVDAPALPEGYQKAAETVAARRMALAGFRTADQLQLAFPQRINDRVELAGIVFPSPATSSSGTPATGGRSLSPDP
jgi:S1/P1 Nuclease